MAIGDILGAGKVFPMDKLADMITNTVGRLFKSHFTRKDIDAKTYELREVAKAQAEAMVTLAEGYKEASQITSGIGYKDDRVTIEAPKELPASQQPIPIGIIEPLLEQRALARVDYQEARKQLNIESVAAIAAEQLKDEESVTDEPVNEDWATRFFNIVEDVSDEEMQALWGRILVGEIKKPKSFSLRTLELLRNLSKEEAEVFTELANLAISDGISNFVFQNKSNQFLEKYNFSFSKVLQMAEVGILNSEQSVYYTIDSVSTSIEFTFQLGDFILLIKRVENGPRIAIPVFKFTQSGSELLKLLTPTASFDYLKDLAKFLKMNGMTVTYSYVMAIAKNGPLYSEFMEIDE